MRFKKVLSNLEAEGQGCGIIMGVTHLLLLGPFYYIALYWGVYKSFLNQTLDFKKGKMVLLKSRFASIVVRRNLGLLPTLIRSFHRPLIHILQHTVSGVVSKPGLSQLSPMKGLHEYCIDSDTLIN